MKIHLAPESICSGCMACVDACPKNTIKVVSKEGLFYPHIDNTNCIECGLCMKVCPVTKPVQAYDISQSGIFAVWSDNEQVRLNAASGGFCSQMAINTIRRGGYATATIMQNNQCLHVLTNSEDEFLQGANSKYIQSNPSGIYKEVRKKLNANFEFLFVGLPCQVSALYRFLRKEYSKLTTIELICSPAPSSDAIKIQNEILGAEPLDKFRKKIPQGMWGGRDHNLVFTKDHGELTLKQTESSQVYYDIFASLFTARASCLDCKFARINRQANFTAGDFHGFRCENSGKGVSLVIAKTEVDVQRLRKEEYLYIKESNWKSAINSNSRLYNGWEGVIYHPVFIWRHFFRNLPIWRNFLLNKYPHRFFWLLFKVWTKIAIKYKKRIVLKKLKYENRDYHYTEM